MNSKIITGTAMIIGLFIIFSFSTNRVMPGDPWPVPDKYEKLKNPVKGDKESISIGKSLYTKHCKSCHGKEGLGDGPKAAQLETSSGDFTSDEFQSQSDGSIYFKTIKGRDDMPGFEKKIPDEEDRWSIVNYLRTLE